MQHINLQINDCYQVETPEQIISSLIGGCKNINFESAESVYNGAIKTYNLTTGKMAYKKEREKVQISSKFLN